MANRRDSEQGGANDLGWPVFPGSQLRDDLGGVVQHRGIVKREPYHQCIASELGIRYDGFQEWPGGIDLVAFTITEEGPAQGQTFYLKEPEVTFEAVRARLVEKLEANCIASSV